MPVFFIQDEIKFPDLIHALKPEPLRLNKLRICVRNFVPDIDFTNDPLLQARLFSYLDTQLSRLGSPNFAQIPINHPVVPVKNLQQDGHMQTKISMAKALYHSNSIGEVARF